MTDGKNNNEVFEIRSAENTTNILGQVIDYLQVFLPVTLAKRLIAIVLLALGVPVKKAIEFSGLSERSLWDLHKRLREESVSSLMTMKYGGGRKEKMASLHDEIAAELENHDYHTRQEIVDMIDEKYHIKTSRTAVGRLLKKGASNG